MIFLLRTFFKNFNVLARLIKMELMRMTMAGIYNYEVKEKEPKIGRWL
jgi:hypothetical protein